MRLRELAGDQGEKSLYAELQAAGIEVDSHESDLYFKHSPEAMAILSKYPIQRKNATGFTSQIDGTRWVDVPFAYEPFWAKKGM